MMNHHRSVYNSNDSEIGKQNLVIHSLPVIELITILAYEL